MDATKIKKIIDQKHKQRKELLQQIKNDHEFIRDELGYILQLKLNRVRAHSGEIAVALHTYSEICKSDFNDLVTFHMNREKLNSVDMANLERAIKRFDRLMEALYAKVEQEV